MAKTAVITGASPIGMGIARAIASECELIILASRNQKKLDEAAKTLSKTKVATVAVDLTNLDEMKTATKTIEQLTDHIDLLVNNAGSYSSKPFAQLTADEIANQIDIIFKAQATLTRLVLPLLEKGKDSQIVNISSIGAITQSPGESVYSASKAAVTAFSNILRKELNEKHIRVTVIQPRSVNTWGAKDPEHYLTTEDIGHLVRYLVTVPPSVQIEHVDISNVHQPKSH